MQIQNASNLPPVKRERIFQILRKYVETRICGSDVCLDILQNVEKCLLLEEGSALVSERWLAKLHFGVEVFRFLRDFGVPDLVTN